ncbi:GAF domain-containing protein [Oleiagrimonas sp. C23AA]|uniref:GAF domain-containing protein n=1 Tax=Oleiagrimonas sp. C23AA TaxID=2719047 RepID=UPI001420701E|nr:GAF domain-containing protein [Oleiagrimonas sp. C23AA]NII09067.1 GAF domain-containing protein [Oleiagrimonas sp. C23AA]
MADPLSNAPDLSSCEREPIHIPGAVQPHGVLLVVDASDRRILQVSGTAKPILEREPTELLGQPLDSVLTLPDTLALDDDSERPLHLPFIPVSLPTRSQTVRSPWCAALHLYDTRWLIEIEPNAHPGRDDGPRNAYPLLRKIEQDASIEHAAARAAKGIRQLLGYDRVMIYRFDSDWNGEVIAEAHADRLEPFLGLHYPATDIPAQARALYVRNRVRQISDVQYTPSPLMPPTDPETNAATDLSDVSLRSVSRVHLEYLGNMGVSATLVASIVVNDKLWGLIACHHYMPLFADHTMREAADAVARSLALRIGALEERNKVTLESALLTVREKLITAFSESDRISADLLMASAPELLDAVDADGVAIYDGDHVVSHGRTPDHEQLLRIRDAIERSRADVSSDIAGVLHTDALGERLPELADVTELAAGIIFMPLRSDSHAALLWTRREQIRDVRWGGNPHLSKLQEIPGARLSPRKSFDAWQEEVRGRSRPWDRQHLESARALRVLIEVMERKHHQNDAGVLRASLSRLQDAVLIVEAAPGAIWPDMPISFVNAAFTRLTGLDEHEVIGHLFSRFVQVPDEASDGDTHEAGQVLHIDVTVHTAMSGDLSVVMELEPVPGEDGGISHYLALLRREH